MKDIIEWREGNGGVEYAVIDHVFKNKRALNDTLPFHMKEDLHKVRITIEEIE